MRHFADTSVVATSLETYRDLIEHNQLIITPAAREDIIQATLQRHWEIKMASPHDDLKRALF